MTLDMLGLAECRVVRLHLVIQVGFSELSFLWVWAGQKLHGFYDLHRYDCLACEVLVWLTGAFQAAEFWTFFTKEL